MALPKTGYYQIERLLGEGGMGAVYEAVHRMTGRRVALKMLRADLAERADLQARFFNEARTISFLDHPGIVRVFDVARADDGAAYMVMELCRGPTLATALRTESRIRVRLGLVGAAADALAYAHAQGVIHRDLKPDNILITAGPDGPQPKILDFGIAKLLEGAAAASSRYAVKTRTGTAIGTPLYMSPEQCRGVGGITPASDVYSLGIIIYECVKGQVPFEGGVGEVIVQHLTTPAPRLSDDTVVDVAPELDPLVAAMLDKSASVRPTMTDVAEVLRQYDAQRREFVIVDLEPITPPDDPGQGPVSPLGETVAPLAAPITAPPVEVGPTRRARPASFLPLLLGGVVAAIAIGAAIYHRTAGRPTPVAAAATPRPAPPATPTPTTAPAAVPAAPTPAARDPWTVDSDPPGADVLLPDGTLLGRTPYVADAVLARGERALHVRMAGYRDEIVRYDAAGQSTIRLRARAPLKARPKGPAAPSKHDDFEVQPLR
jgi:serine/threonine-protein kinase